MLQFKTELQAIVEALFYAHVSPGNILGELKPINLLVYFFLSQFIK